ncbi:hypothetical protein [Asanoa sp. NPDC050611]
MTATPGDRLLGPGLRSKVPNRPRVLRVKRGDVSSWAVGAHRAFWGWG